MNLRGFAALALLLVATGMERFAYYGARAFFSLDLRDHGETAVTITTTMGVLQGVSLVGTLVGGALAFAIGPDGTLGDRQMFADLGEAVPDGICLDSEGAVWVGSLTTCQFLRIARGGRILDEIGTDGWWAVACILGGSDRRTLFLLTAKTTVQTLRQPGGTLSRIEVTRVSVPGAGWP